MVVEYLVQSMKESSQGLPDFVLCVGDDRSDEDMFEKLEGLINSNEDGKKINVFACTVCL
jgi:trehalose 6-phosphate synthase/phosphatase